MSEFPVSLLKTKACSLHEDGDGFVDMSIPLEAFELSGANASHSSIFISRISLPTDEFEELVDTEFCFGPENMDIPMEGEVFLGSDQYPVELLKIKFTSLDENRLTATAKLWLGFGFGIWKYEHTIWETELLFVDHSGENSITE